MIKIIVVDDEPIIREGIIQILEEQFDDIAEILLAEDGEVAYELIIENRIDIVITDVNMPILNGIDMLKAVKQAKCNCHVIVISGYKQFEFVSQAIKLGAIDYLLKPIDEKKLIDIVKKTINTIVVERQQKKEIKDNQKRIMQLENDFFVSYIINLLFGYKKNDIRNAKISTKLNKLINAKVFQVVVCSFEDDDSSNKYYSDISGCYLENMQKNECIVIKNENQIIIVFYSSNINSDMFEETNKLNFLYPFFDDKYNKRINIGVSEKTQDLNKLQKAYIDAEIANFFNFFYKSDKASYFEDIWNECKNCTKDVNHENKFLEIVESGSLMEIDNIMIETIKIIIGSEKDKSLFGIKSFLINIFSLSSERGGFDSIEPKDQIINKLEKIKKSNNVFEIFNIGKECLFLINKTLNSGDMKIERKIIKEAKQYISDNLCEKLSLEQIAKEFYFSPNYFSILFAKSVGQTFTQYLIQERIALAKKILNDPKIKIYEISEMVGYKEPRNFMRTFKANTGMTMSRYREKYFNQ